jgi:hypothetical protein
LPSEHLAFWFLIEIIKLLCHGISVHIVLLRYNEFRFTTAVMDATMMIRLNKSTLRHWKDQARKSGITLSDMVRLSVENHITNKKQQAA